MSILYLLRYTDQSSSSETYGLVIIGMMGGVLFAKLGVLIGVIVKQAISKCRRKNKKANKIKPNLFVSEMTFT